jgi:hypothetical protein
VNRDTSSVTDLTIQRTLALSNDRTNEVITSLVCKSNEEPKDAVPIKNKNYQNKDKVKLSEQVEDSSVK